MIKRLFGMHHLNITQGRYNAFSHKTLNAYDLAGSDAGIDFYTATSELQVIGVWKFNGNAKQTFANTVHFYDAENDVTISMTHENTIPTNCTVGRVYYAGDVIYQEGTAGYATGNHIHLEIGKGRQPKKVLHSGGFYGLVDWINFEDYFYADDRVTVVNCPYVLSKGADKMGIPYGYSTQSYNGITAKVYLSKSADGYTPYLITADDYNALKSIGYFDADCISKDAVINCSYFQMRTGQADAHGTHYGVEQDSRIGGYTQAPKGDGLIVYAIRKDGSTDVMDAKDFWDAEEDNLCAFTPYAVRLHGGVKTYYRSTAFGDKDDIKNTQSVLFKTAEGDWGVANFSACCPRDTVEFLQAFGQIDELCLFDSGGSAQMRALTGGSVKLVAAGDKRLLPSVIALAKPAKATGSDSGKVESTIPGKTTETLIQEQADEIARLSAEVDALERKIKNAQAALNE